MKTDNYKYYGGYTNYKMSSTIQLSHETKKLIGTFGTKDDTYETIIKRLYSMAVKEQLRELLMSSEDTISIEEARKRHAEKWSE
ncbi:MAG: hypothetical protein K9N07_10035 [Candidatus Cloacimonetes bacterium]|nr:hypothetical protein [Candidatus Cloacimonadota bacterium]